MNTLIHEQVEFHNVAAFEPVPGHGPCGMVRYPEAVRQHMIADSGYLIGASSMGCEIRFVTGDPRVEVFLSCTKPQNKEKGQVRIFRGDVEVMDLELEPGRVHNLFLIEPPAFGNVARETLDRRSGFSSQVWRVATSAGTFCFHGVDSHGRPLRPPEPREKPATRWLAYGSSITNAWPWGYVQVAARLLKVDLQNKGLAGACLLEKEVADWLSGEGGFDLITCELGINARGRYTPEEFKDRVRYLLGTLVDKHPDTQVVGLNIFPNGMSRAWTALPEEEGGTTAKEEAFNAVVRRVCSELDAPNLHFIEGSEILRDFAGLSGDLLHPTPYGHATMGHNLASKLRELIDG